jgi:hypothetical protein
MSEVTARPLQVTARMPTKEDADAIGAKVPSYIEPAPYVREKLTGMIHYWQDWMRPLGDVLEPCWDAPPMPRLIVPTSPMDFSHYLTQQQQIEALTKALVQAQAQPQAQAQAPNPVAPPTAQAPAPPVLPASEKSVRRPHRKGNKPAAQSRASVSSTNDGNAR